MFHSYRDLRVWRVSMDLVEVIYKISAKFPSDERFGLTSQMRRASISIPSNIAEGYRRSGALEKKKFVGYAYGSASELETQLYIAQRLGFTSSDSELFLIAEDRMNHCLRLINRYLASFDHPLPDHPTA